MQDGAIKTLFLPFDSGDIETGGEAARWLFLNAGRPPQDCAFVKSQITAVQGMRPDFKALESAGFTVTPEVSEGTFDGALIAVSRHRGQTRAVLNQALARVKPGGMIVFAGSKNDGVATAAKEVGGQFELIGSLSKHHAKAYWFANTGSNRFDEAAPEQVDGRFEAAPGMFSSDHIDPGSAFLIEQLPRDIKGRVADFCAGWGYLAVETATACPAVKSIALYEADHASLEAAKANMARLAPQMEAAFHWQDLIAEKASGDYDTIIMNPPFHQGRAADPAIGIAIIRNAHNALHKGGKLYLVANRNLPYEATLTTMFFKSGELGRNAYYKVLWATK
ncbi:MAG: class I SAM-dependent methyltransferase [Rhizobiaceae bacterium]